MSDLVNTKIKNGVLHVILNRPKKKNALNIAMYEELAKAIIEGDSNPDVRVLLFYGVGDSYCAGNDIKDFQERNPKTRDPNAPNFMISLISAQKPMIAAIHGFAVGVGVTMLFHFDLVYAAKSTILRFPFVNLGLTPEYGSSYLLPKMAGYNKAAELLFFGDKFSAEKAMEIGIVNKIFEDDILISEATKLAETLAEKSPTSLKLTKQLMKKYDAEFLKTFIVEEGRIFVQRQLSEEAQEAFTAFFEKRKPDFSKFM